MVGQNKWEILVSGWQKGLEEQRSLIGDFMESLSAEGPECFDALGLGNKNSTGP